MAMSDSHQAINDTSLRSALQYAENALNTWDRAQLSTHFTWAKSVNRILACRLDCGVYIDGIVAHRPFDAQFEARTIAVLINDVQRIANTGPAAKWIVHSLLRNFVHSATGSWFADDPLCVGAVPEQDAATQMALALRFAGEALNEWGRWPFFEHFMWALDSEVPRRKMNPAPYIVGIIDSRPFDASTLAVLIRDVQRSKGIGPVWAKWIVISLLKKYILVATCSWFDETPPRVAAVREEDAIRQVLLHAYLCTSEQRQQAAYALARHYRPGLHIPMLQRATNGAFVLKVQGHVFDLSTDAGNRERAHEYVVRSTAILVFHLFMTLHCIAAACQVPSNAQGGQDHAVPKVPRGRRENCGSSSAL